LSNDFTVLTILDESGSTAKILRFTGTTIEAAASTIIDTLRRYKPRGGYIETNNIGRAIFEQVRSAGIKCKGFTTTQESKLKAVRTLIEDIESGNLMLPSQKLMPECYNELSAYTYKVNTNGKLSFSHPPGMHDDLVDSLWLANSARNELGSSSGGLYVGNMVKNVNPRFG